MNRRGFLKKLSAFAVASAFPSLSLVKEEFNVLPNFRLVATTTGRWSSSSPNFSQIPKHSADAAKIITAFRDQFQAYQYLLNANYKDLELRILSLDRSDT